MGMPYKAATGATSSTTCFIRKVWSVYNGGDSSQTHNTARSSHALACEACTAARQPRAMHWWTHARYTSRTRLFWLAHCASQAVPAANERGSCINFSFCCPATLARLVRGGGSIRRSLYIPLDPYLTTSFHHECAMR